MNTFNLGYLLSLNTITLGVRSQYMGVREGIIFLSIPLPKLVKIPELYTEKGGICKLYIHYTLQS